MPWFNQLKEFAKPASTDNSAETSISGDEILRDEGSCGPEGPILALIESLAQSVAEDREGLRQGRHDGVLTRTAERQRSLHELESTLNAMADDIRSWPETNKDRVEAAFKALSWEAEKTCIQLRALYTASQSISTRLLEAAERQLSDGTYGRNGKRGTSPNLSLNQFSAKL